MAPCHCHKSSELHISSSIILLLLLLLLFSLLVPIDKFKLGFMLDLLSLWSRTNPANISVREETRIGGRDMDVSGVLELVLLILLLFIAFIIDLARLGAI